MTIGKYMELILIHTLFYEITCYSSINDNSLVPILCIYISDFFFIRHSLGIRRWHFGWWMLKCIPTWVFWPHLLPLLIVEYSFIRWFDSLLTHLVEKGLLPIFMYRKKQRQKWSERLGRFSGFPGLLHLKDIKAIKSESVALKAIYCMRFSIYL